MSLQLTMERMNNSFFPTQSIHSCLQLIWKMQPRQNICCNGCFFLGFFALHISTECTAINEEKLKMESTYFLQTKRSIMVQTYISFVDNIRSAKLIRPRNKDTIRDKNNECQATKMNLIRVSINLICFVLFSI